MRRTDLLAQEVVQRCHDVAPVDPGAPPEARPGWPDRIRRGRRGGGSRSRGRLRPRRRRGAGSGPGRWLGSAARCGRSATLVSGDMSTQSRNSLACPTVLAIVGHTNNLRGGIDVHSLGPRLIGETEKTLNALFVRFLDGTGLTEPQWVVLRLADAADGTDDDLVDRRRRSGALHRRHCPRRRAHHTGPARGRAAHPRRARRHRSRAGQERSRIRRRSGRTFPPTTSPPPPDS